MIKVEKTTKLCTKCLKIKELLQFHNIKHKNGKTYKRSMCKACWYAYNKKEVSKWVSKPINKEKLNAKRREQRKDPLVKEKIAIRKRESHLRNVKTNLLSRAKKRAAFLNLPFELTKEDILIPEFCPILEIPLFVGTKKDYKNSPSIDRIIPELGYTKSNIRVISMLANTMKNSASKDLLEKFSKNILNYINNNDIVQTIENKNL